MVVWERVLEHGREQGIWGKAGSSLSPMVLPSIPGLGSLLCWALMQRGWFSTQ